MIVAGGGTGGHLFPGLAVAEALAAQEDTSILFVGSAYGLEATAVPKTRFPFRALRVRGLRRRGVRGVLEFVWRLPLAVLQSWHIVGTFQPTLVLGLGGYGSVPVAVVAWLRRIPLVLLEQNVHPGLANRGLARLARKICTTYAESAHFFPAGKVVHTGNPVRQLSSTRGPSPGHFTIFVFGGSQGAHAINCAMVDAAVILAEQISGLRILHQTGAAGLKWVQQRYGELGVDAEIFEFVGDMGDAYGRADLVVCRAGATTLAELSTVARPSILVPYPFAADDHQRANAEILRDRGAAEMLVNAELSGERLAACVLALARDRERLRTMGTAAGSLAVPDATTRVVTVCRLVEAEER
ncbi:MAG: undecaprenyldiphospho-muramoylpentapeptide beta-N-acetylglucosaminyltransferase [Candidatus Binatia bacterium]